MEGVMSQWKEEEEVEEIGLIERQATMLMSVKTQATEQTLKDRLIEEQEFSRTELNSGVNKKNTTLHPSDAEILVDSTSLNYVTNESEKVGIIVAENVQPEKELCLESLYQKPTAQGFYCPNCKACIQKVLLLDPAVEETSLPAQPPSSPDTFRCSSCFSFLIPIGSWLFPGRAHGSEVSTSQGVQRSPEHSKEELSDERTKAAREITAQGPDQVNTGADSGKQILQPDRVMNDGVNEASNEEEDHKTRGSNLDCNIKLPDSSNICGEIPPDEHDQDGSRSRQPLQLEEVKVDDRISVPRSTTLPTTTRTDVVQESGNSTTWEIRKSIVYGGLNESIASLSIVTSSASSDATTLNILVLSLANLIGGLFILVHNIWDLKSEEPKTSNQTNAHADRYYEQVLGKRENLFLHVCIATLSFIIFGLVPPLVYTFTFWESNNENLKLAAVAGASAICITLLSLAKAHIQRPNTYLTYFKTVLYYLGTGAMASIFSNLAGELFKNLLKSLDGN